VDKSPDDRGAFRMISIVRRTMPVWGVAACLGLLVAVGWAQSGDSKSKTKTKAGPVPDVKVLNGRMLKTMQSLDREFTELARGYEDAGQFEEARTLWEVLLKLNPKYPGAEDKIKSLSERMLSETEFTLKLDPTDDWTPVAMVTKDQPVRIEARGEYQYTVPLKGDPSGVAGNDLGTDMQLANGVPLGALMGVVVGADKKPGKPFRVGTQLDTKASATGLLLLKVNLPPGARAVSDKLDQKLTIRVSGAKKAG
jgi:tetratricopeptide (TPR) repeat protein